jgi:hypothetical protein
MTIKLPDELLQDTLNDTNDTRIQFIGYRRSQLFVPHDGFPNISSLELQRVISASVKGSNNKNLSVPVTIHLPLIEVIVLFVFRIFLLCISLTSER